LNKIYWHLKYFFFFKGSLKNNDYENFIQKYFGTIHCVRWSQRFNFNLLISWGKFLSNYTRLSFQCVNNSFSLWEFFFAWFMNFSHHAKCLKIWNWSNCDCLYKKLLNALSFPSKAFKVDDKNERIETQFGLFFESEIFPFEESIKNCCRKTCCQINQLKRQLSIDFCYWFRAGDVGKICFQTIHFRVSTLWFIMHHLFIIDKFRENLIFFLWE
jgi:hypothetical protein